MEHRSERFGYRVRERRRFPFTSSTTLYAQWKASIIPVVTFSANRGKGAMNAQSSAAPAALNKVAFTRAGFSFTGWNTAANGSGTAYANGASFPFTSSTTLYAQWKRNKVVVLPAVPAVVTLGQFAPKSSTLTPSQETEIARLASEIKANHDTKISLVGYGDTLSAANQLNESAWAANFTLSQDRATIVASYLKSQLTAVGLTNYSISAEGNGTANSVGSPQSAAQEAINGRVIARLS